MILCTELLTWIALFIIQGASEKDSPRKGDKADAKVAKPEPKKAAAAAADATAAASPKTESKLKKRAEIELEGKFISK